MDTSNPGPLLLLGGGVVIALGSLLNWGPDTSGLNTDFNGLFGIICLLIGIGFAAVGGIRAFAPSTNLPDNIGGFSLDEPADVAWVHAQMASRPLAVRTAIVRQLGRRQAEHPQTARLLAMVLAEETDPRIRREAGETTARSR